MKVTCPSCGCVLDTKEAKDAPIQALNGLYRRFNLAEKIVREYILLFRPASGVMTLPRETRLVGDLLKIWEEGYFERDGRGWTIDKDSINGALQGVCNGVSALKGGHGYLLTVLKAKALEVSRREERDKHDRARQRARTVDQGMAPVKAALVEISDEERARMKAKITADKEKLFGKRGGTD